MAPVCSFLSDAGGKMANRRYTGLLRRAFGPYRVPSAQPHKVTIEEDSILNPVYMNRIALSPTQAQLTDSLHETTQKTRPRQKNHQQRKAAKDFNNATKGDTTVAQEYVGSRIRRHMNTPQRMYIVRWNEYPPGVDTIEPPHDIPNT